VGTESHFVEHLGVGVHGRTNLDPQSKLQQANQTLPTPVTV
jgi:hypothetical protein